MRLVDKSKSKKVLRKVKIEEYLIVEVKHCPYKYYI